MKRNDVSYTAKCKLLFSNAFESETKYKVEFKDEKEYKLNGTLALSLQLLDYKRSLSPSLSLVLCMCVA